MTRININGKGFVEMDGNIGFKATNPWYRFAEVEMLRSIEFDVPMTEHNRFLFGYTDDPMTDGEFSRRKHPCQMVADSVVRNGFLVVSGRKADRFACVYYEDDGVLSRINGRKLSECPKEYLMPQGIVWGGSTPTKQASAVGWEDYCAIVSYARNLPSSANKQELVSVNVYRFLTSLLEGFGVPHAVNGLSTDLWMVCPTLNKANEWSVDFRQIDNFDVDVREDTDTPVFEVVNITLQHADWVIWGVYGGIDNYSARAFRATKKVNISFQLDFPTGVYLIKWSSRLSKCKVLGGGGDDDHPSYGVLAGDTVSLEEGDVVFFADTPIKNLRIGGYGWAEIKQGFVDNFVASIDAAMEAGDTWQLADNMPDCTVFEYLQWVCRATGLEWWVANGVLHVGSGTCGETVRNIGKAIRINEVTRCVDAWGRDTRRAVVRFDSDDYVTEHITTEYAIDNDNLTEDRDYKIGFSEGGDNGLGSVFIRDFDYDYPHDIVAKKWTLAMAGPYKLLRRIEAPAPIGYDDIAERSTVLELQVVMSEMDLFNTLPGDVFLWNGVPFLWSSIDYKDGVASLTLQQVTGSSF